MYAPLTRQHQDTPPDVQAVLDAAWALRVGEFDLFRLAYRRWFGRSEEEKDLERIFVRYMFHQRVPPWVRHFCRQVLDEAAAGTLERQRFGAEAVRRREALVSFPRSWIGLSMAFALLAYLAILALAG